jgi:hypothetical protein
MKWLKFFETSENIHARSQLHFQKTWALNDTAVSTSKPHEVLKLLLLKTVVVCPWISKYPFVPRRSLHSTVTGSQVHERYDVWTRRIACLRKTGCCYLHFRCHVLTTRTPCLSPQDGQITPADSDRHTNVRCCPLRCVQWEMPRLLAHARTHAHTQLCFLSVLSWTLIPHVMRRTYAKGVRGRNLGLRGRKWQKAREKFNNVRVWWCVFLHKYHSGSSNLKWWHGRGM